MNGVTYNSYGLKIENEYEWSRFVKSRKDMQEKETLEILEHHVGKRHAHNFGTLLALAYDNNISLFEKINSYFQFSQTEILSFSNDVDEFEEALIEEMNDRISDED